MLHGKSKRLWKKDNPTHVMKQLLKSQAGYLLYTDLCKDLGQKIVDSLIEHNIIHLWLCSMFSFDLSSLPDDDAVVTAHSACGLFAMKRCLQKIAVVLCNTCTSVRYFY